jgi:hypothetical protein
MTDMKPDQVARDLHTLGLSADVINAWLEDLSALPAQADLTTPLWWLDETALRATCSEMAYTPAIQDAFSDTAHELRKANPAWQTLIRLAAQVWMQPSRERRGKAFLRPGPAVETWGLLADMYRPLVFLTMLPAMIARHRAMGIDEQIIRDTADDLPLWMEEHHRKFGRWGTCDSAGWFCVHLNGELFKLGRLQFEFGEFELPFVILQDDAGRPHAVVKGQHLIRADGQFASADHGIDQNAADNWTTLYTDHENDADIIGHAAEESGSISSTVYSFPTDSYKRLVAPGDPIISVHIPARGKLDLAACEASFTQARDFFQRYFPAYNARIFTCSSWLMDPQLTGLKQSQSNLSRFVKLFHSLPIPSGNSDQMFERVFDNECDIATLPRDTSLRRDILAHIEAGGRWRSASGYRLIH